MSNTEIDDYRQKVFAAMMSREGADEQEMKETLDLFTDEDLAFGMPFNTPEETAQMILDE